MNVVKAMKRTKGLIAAISQIVVITAGHNSECMTTYTLS